MVKKRKNLCVNDKMSTTPSDYDAHQSSASSSLPSNVQPYHPLLDRDPQTGKITRLNTHSKMLFQKALQERLQKERTDLEKQKNHGPTGGVKEGDKRAKKRRDAKQLLDSLRRELQSRKDEKSPRDDVIDDQNWAALADREARMVEGSGKVF